MSGTTLQEDSFWDILKLFWSPERVATWRQAILSERETEVCYNLLTLARHVRACWEQALFALKPLDVAADQKTMRVQFFWLRKHPKRSIKPLSTQPDLPADFNEVVGDIKLYDCTTEGKIFSGDILTLKTHDPANRPLPDVALLEMQWYLHRLTALCGGPDAILNGPAFRGYGDESPFSSDYEERWDNDSVELISSSVQGEEATGTNVPLPSIEV